MIYNYKGEIAFAVIILLANGTLLGVMPNELAKQKGL